MFTRILIPISIAVAMVAAPSDAKRRAPVRHHAPATRSLKVATHRVAAQRSVAPHPPVPSNCPTFYFHGAAPRLTAVGAQQPPVFCYAFYSVGYSTTLRDPLWSAEFLTREIAIGGDNTTRLKSIKFAPQAGLSEDEQGSHFDYVNPPYDRGHMTPANDAADNAAQKDTFMVTNIVPQTSVLNEHLWANLEASVHELAEEDGQVYIVTGPIFGSHPQLMSGRIAIPPATFKAIYDPKRDLAIGFIATDLADPTPPVCTVVSIAEITRQSGVDPFPALSASKKASVPHFALPNGRQPQAGRPARILPLPDCR